MYNTSSSKLMSYYGFNVKSGKWDTRLFPITQSDAQLEGIKSDVQRYNNAVRDYDIYADHLAKEYCINIEDEMKKGHIVIFSSSFFCCESINII